MDNEELLSLLEPKLVINAGVHGAKANHMAYSDRIKDDYDVGHCPNCNARVNRSWNSKSCGKCPQQILWPESEYTKEKNKLKKYKTLNGVKRKERPTVLKEIKSEFDEWIDTEYTDINLYTIREYNGEDILVTYDEWSKYYYEQVNKLQNLITRRIINDKDHSDLDQQLESL